MASDAVTTVTAVAADLPEWLKWGANAGLFVALVLGSLWSVRKARHEEREHESEPFDPVKLLDASPVRQIIAAAETVADNAKLQTEALKTISAAAAAMAKTVEDDFDERRVQREVDRRLQEQRLLREARG